LPSCSGGFLGQSITISNLLKNSSLTSNIVAAATLDNATPAFVFTHSASWFGTEAPWLFGSDSSGNAVGPSNQFFTSITAGDFSAGGSRSVILGIPSEEGFPDKFDSGAFLRWPNSGSNTFVASLYWDEGTTSD
ncbi:MAG TPA: hypothetical protein VGO00_15350, partial [Kofleriaceae bacterium]|nr:hypothetical protein [Kofleriaceae bacterium]